jgi:hypothetical protein
MLAPPARRSLHAQLLLCVSSLFVTFFTQVGTGFASGDSGEDLTPFAGEWQLIEYAPDEARRSKAIDRALESLNFLYRTMAAPVLRKTTVPPPRIQFTWDGESLYQRTLGVKNEQSRRVELGAGPQQGLDSRGEPFESTWQWTDAGLRLHWQQNQARGHNTYQLDPESGNLIVFHTIQITAISNVAPIVYQARFGREALPTVSAAQESSGLDLRKMP